MSAYISTHLIPKPTLSAPSNCTWACLEDAFYNLFQRVRTHGIGPIGADPETLNLVKFVDLNSRKFSELCDLLFSPVVKANKMLANSDLANQILAIL